MRLPTAALLALAMFGVGLTSLAYSIIGPGNGPNDDLSIPFWSFLSRSWEQTSDNPLNTCSIMTPNGRVFDNPCIISWNIGGLAGSFEAAAREINEKKINVEINGPCYSGCSTFAAYGRPRVCVTRNALMGFHQGSNEEPQPLPRDVKEWVESHGGFPTFESDATTDMKWPETKRFWSVCNDVRMPM